MPIEAAHISVLRRHHLFSTLSEEQFQAALESCRTEQLRPGVFLFRRGEPADNFFVLLAGQVNLTVTSKAGAEKIAGIVRPGESFAEAVMFLDAPVYPVSARAAAQSEVAKIRCDTFIALLRGSPETCFQLLASLSRRLHEKMREIEYLALESATHRLIHAMESRLPSGQTEADTIELEESRQELASRLSMTPETLSRILRNLSDAGVIVVNGRSLQIPDRIRLLSLLDVD